MSASTSRQKYFKSFAKALAVPLLALTFVLAPSFTPTGHVDIAHAKSAKKKVEFGLKIVGKGLAKVEKAGKAAQKKRGIVGKAGGILKNAAKGGQKGVKAAEKGIGKVTKGANRLIGKSKLGRTAQKAYRKAGKWQTKQINKAFRNCRGKACNIAEGAAKFVAPL